MDSFFSGVQLHFTIDQRLHVHHAGQREMLRRPGRRRPGRGRSRTGASEPRAGALCNQKLLLHLRRRGMPLAPRKSGGQVGCHRPDPGGCPGRRRGRRLYRGLGAGGAVSGDGGIRPQSCVLVCPRQHGGRAVFLTAARTIQVSSIPDTITNAAVLLVSGVCLLYQLFQHICNDVSRSSTIICKITSSVWRIPSRPTQPKVCMVWSASLPIRPSPSWKPNPCFAIR